MFIPAFPDNVVSSVLGSSCSMQRNKFDPNFSYDARQGAWNQGSRWSDDGQFGRRAYFHLQTSPAQLAVDKIQPSEAGVYRCRVDFKTAPTRNTLVNLTIIGEFSKPPILSSAI